MLIFLCSLQRTVDLESYQYIYCSSKSSLDIMYIKLYCNRYIQPGQLSRQSRGLKILVSPVQIWFLAKERHVFTYKSLVSGVEPMYNKKERCFRVRTCKAHSYEQIQRLWIRVLHKEKNYVTANSNSNTSWIQSWS